ncbi:hypothetical protein JG687_00017639 [Phytophthora cactorum]|uniref:HNH nuclease domain-containing protein n=1 Tax=Phytophthora cactorum TaxID=29920 RepID=A0A8T1TPT3_9STRA|nr:hypothetical protein PC120_g10998 [Phytophthora cactorum]KAG3074867.1 hypothetical protein PC121_g8227 [Phytophthora cactorum]KAG4052285.1 hypothetical protein PC123_g12533 [Phytophthora cactorum]KAG6944807.1 hypothetical protein JG687_00017639 [Phytophthora cactorum]
MQETIRSPAIVLLEVILPHILRNDPTTLTDRNENVKEGLCEFYGCYRRQETFVRCMLLDTVIPEENVSASHLFRRSNENQSSVMMQISNIDDVRNGLLQFKPLKHVFDYFLISFILDNMDDLGLKLFDASIRDTRLIDLTDRNGNKVLTDKQTKIFLGSISSRNKKKRCHFNEQKTFGDVDGRTLAFTGLERPFYRCLNLQARLARVLALMTFPDFWSEVSLDDKMELFNRCIIETDDEMF